MIRVTTLPLVVLVLMAQCVAQAPASTSGNPANASTVGESSSKARPDLPPAPSDAPVPPKDSSTENGKKSGVKSLVDRAAPHCFYVIFSTCWNLRGSEGPEAETPNGEFDKNMEVADYYYKRGNFRAAESRYRDALSTKPNDPEATFRLAQSFDKLKDVEHARVAYEAYLMVAPDGPHAGDAKKALQNRDQRSGSREQKASEKPESTSQDR